MSRPMRTPLLVAAAFTAISWSAAAQEAPAAPVEEAPAAAEAAPETATPDEDNMADLLNSRQQVKQDVTLTRSVDGKVVETRKETVVYSKDDPLRASEAGLSTIDLLKAKFDSEALTRKEALEEAKSDFVIADLDRDSQMTAEEFVFLVKGWESAEISGSGQGRFVDPYFHVDEAEAAAEHETQARSKFSEIAGVDPGAFASINRKAFIRRIIDDFEAQDVDRNEILQGEELLNFRASVRGETILPVSSE